MIWRYPWNKNLWALVIIVPYDRSTLLMLQWCTQLPCGSRCSEVTDCDFSFQHTHALLSVPSPTQPWTQFYALLLTLKDNIPSCFQLLEDVHITKGEFPCPSRTAELSHTKAGLHTDFHFVPLKLAHWQQGWSARAAPCLQGPQGRAWMHLQGHSSTDCSSYKKRYHPAFCHLHRKDIWQLHFNQLFCLSYLFHPCERSSMTSSAMPQHVLVTQSLQMGQTPSHQFK